MQLTAEAHEGPGLCDLPTGAALSRSVQGCPDCAMASAVFSLRSSPDARPGGGKFVARCASRCVGSWTLSRGCEAAECQDQCGDEGTEAAGLICPLHTAAENRRADKSRTSDRFRRFDSTRKRR